jgi:hypothetical protein
MFHTVRFQRYTLDLHRHRIAAEEDEAKRVKEERREEGSAVQK